MQLVRAVVLLAAAAAAVGQYLQERVRLSVIDKLPAQQALARCEERRRRSERTMTVAAALATVAGLLALGDMVLAR